MEDSTAETQSVQLALNEASSATPCCPEDAAKKKKKEDRCYEYIVKALSSLNTPEEKLAALCKKYVDLYQECKELRHKVKAVEKQLTTVTREKDQLQGDHSRVVMHKSKLETLCRELQKQKNMVKDESVSRARAEEEKRKEVSNRFQTTITEIQSQVAEYCERNNQLREENRDLAEKFTKFLTEYEKREEQVAKIIQTKELESQLADVKLKQSTLSLEEERARYAHDRTKMSEELSLLKSQLETRQEFEVKLREQIDFYKAKYEEFSTTLSSSNALFNSCKAEMEKMNQRMQKLNKENHAWKQKYENSSQAVLQFAQEKVDHEKELTTLRAQVTQLTGLCRALQADRTRLRSAAQDTKKEDEATLPDATEAPSSSVPPETDQPNTVGPTCQIDTITSTSSQDEKMEDADRDGAGCENAGTP